MSLQSIPLDRNPHGPTSRGAPARSPARPAFTLVELLVVIGIIALLISILIPSLSKARAQATAIKCASNLKQVGTAIKLYQSQYKGYFAPYHNWGRWNDPSNPKLPIDAAADGAYWGVSYAVAGNLTKEVFNCPAAAGTDGAAGGNANFDGTFDEGSIYTCYGLNGYGGPDSGFDDAKRTTIFGVPGELALFVRRSPPAVAKEMWVGRQSARMKFSAKIILAQDSYEQAIDGNGDTFNNWYQWASPDLSGEFLRHNKKANVVFADTHVEPLTREELSEERLYTGRW